MEWHEVVASAGIEEGGDSGALVVSSAKISYWNGMVGGNGVHVSLVGSFGGCMVVGLLELCTCEGEAAVGGAEVKGLWFGDVGDCDNRWLVGDALVLVW